MFTTSRTVGYGTTRATVPQQRDETGCALAAGVRIILAALFAVGGEALMARTVLVSSARHTFTAHSRVVGAAGLAVRKHTDLTLALDSRVRVLTGAALVRIISTAHVAVIE